MAATVAGRNKLCIDRLPENFRSWSQTTQRDRLRYLVAARTRPNILRWFGTISGCSSHHVSVTLWNLYPFASSAATSSWRLVSGYSYSGICHESWTIFCPSGLDMNTPYRIATFG